jgi:hypothetical protein
MIGPKDQVRRSLGAFLGVFLLFPSMAFACALPPSVILTLPTGHYITGAALTVALTAVMGAMHLRLPDMTPRMVYDAVPRVPRLALTYVSFMGFLAVFVLGLLGPNDPMHNLVTLVFWTGVWIALPLASMLVGNLWWGLTPWHAPVRILRSLIGWNGRVGLDRLGHWPAVAGLAAFSWFQIVSLSPSDPETLLQALAVYYLAVLFLGVLEGEAWLDKGEFLTVFFAMVSRIAPFWRERVGGRVTGYIGWPGSQVLRMPAFDLSQMAFVTVALGALTFEGLSETFFWLGLVGENPLEFSGRSAVMGVNTAGLVLGWAATAISLWVVLALGRHWGGQTFAAGPVMLSFLAIAAGYHTAHFFVTLLTSAQYTLSALNDPLFRGDALLGLPPFYVSLGFLSDAWVMTSLYAVQFGAILGAHLLAVVLVLKLVGPQARALAHAPMTALMVGYTVLGLWLLSTARGV